MFYLVVTDIAKELFKTGFFQLQVLMPQCEHAYADAVNDYDNLVECLKYYEIGIELDSVDFFKYKIVLPSCL